MYTLSMGKAWRPVLIATESWAGPGNETTHKRFEGYSVITALVHNVNNGNTEECIYIVLGH